MNIKSAVATERLVLFAEVKNAISMLPVAEWELTPREDDERTALLSTPIAVSILNSAVRSFAVSSSEPCCFFCGEFAAQSSERSLDFFAEFSRAVRYALSINSRTIRECSHPLPGAHHLYPAIQAQTVDETLSVVIASLAQRQCPKSMP